MQTFSTEDGLKLSLVKTGDGLPFVFQHGLCGAASQPAQVFPFDSGYRCITLECRGHGASEAGSVENFSIATFTADIARFIETEIAAPVVIGGISMGAAIALRLAVKRPDLVRGLVLARPAWVIAANPANNAANAFVGQLLQNHTPSKAREIFEASAMAKELSVAAPDNLASLRSFFSREPTDITAQLLSRIAADGPGVSEVEVMAIQKPTLVIGHGRDVVHPLAYARELAALIPTAKLVEITAKADNLDAYVNDFRTSLASFLKGL